MPGSLFENHHTIMLLIDPRTAEIVDANPAAVAFYGWTREQLRSMRISDINALSQAEIDAEMEKARREPSSHFFFPHRLSDGSIRNVEIYTGPVEFEGRQLFYSIVHDISERAEAESALAQEAIRRRILFERAQDGICVTGADYELLEANQSFASMIGRSLDELDGLHVWDWDVTYANREALLERWPDLPRMADTFETRWRRSDGVELDVEINASPVEWSGQKGTLAVCRDITARKRDERHARRWQSMFEVAEFGLTYADSTTKTLIASNESFARQRGYTSDEITGMPILDLYAPEEHVKMKERFSAIEESGYTTFETVHIRKDGSRFPVHMEVTAVPDADGVARTWVAYASDMTARKEAEAEVQRMNDSLQQLVRERTQELSARNEELHLTARELAVTNEQLERANETKTRFLRAMSHELRTPLNSILGFSGVMLDGLAGPVTDEQHHQLEMIRSSGKHLLALVNDILDLSRIEAGRWEIDSAEIDIDSMSRELLAVVGPGASAKGLSMSLELSPDAKTARLVSDPLKVRQILLNLLGNAVKYTSKGGVTLDVRCPDADTVEFAVSDSGAGIPADDLDSVFGEFTQRHRDLDVLQEGTGLGLAISQDLAALLSGSLKVTSEVGAGSTFTLTLPLVQIQ